jgi:hypothetical protein
MNGLKELKLISCPLDGCLMSKLSKLMEKYLLKYIIQAYFSQNNILKSQKEFKDGIKYIMEFWLIINCMKMMFLKYKTKITLEFYMET